MCSKVSSEASLAAQPAAKNSQHPLRKPHCPTDWMSISRPHAAALVASKRRAAHRRTRRDAQGPAQWNAAMSATMRKGVIRSKFQLVISSHSRCPRGLDERFASTRRRLRRRQRRAAHRRTRRNVRARRSGRWRCACRCEADAIRSSASLANWIERQEGLPVGGPLWLSCAICVRSARSRIGWRLLMHSLQYGLATRRRGDVV
jgi:hypothetical protein